MQAWREGVGGRVMERQIDEKEGKGRIKVKGGECEGDLQCCRC